MSCPPPGMEHLTGIRSRRRPIDHALVAKGAGWKMLRKLANGRDGVSVLLCSDATAGTTNSDVGGSGDGSGGDSKSSDDEYCHVAIKIVPTHELDDTARRRLQDEIDILSYLAGGCSLVAPRGSDGGIDGFESLQRRHPHLLRLVHHQRLAGFEMLSCAPLRGGALHRHLRAMPNAYFPRYVALYYAAELASALEHLHEHGIAHRDLKASNVVLDGDQHATLVDFGFAKRGLERSQGSAAGGEASAVMRATSFCGTPHAMAPEMMSRNGHGLEVDWWALGVLLWEMLDGSPPFGYGEGGIDVLSERVVRGIDESAMPLSRDPADAATRQMLSGLLAVDPAIRLGGRRGEIFANPAWSELFQGKRCSSGGGSDSSEFLRLLPAPPRDLLALSGEEEGAY